MVMKAKERLQQKVANHPIGFELLPEKIYASTASEFI
jgi:hypothetical protein